uniref:hypothetical protein n=1 Tax=Photorhabdus sp. RM322S TaxID=3342825 RepID=UPI0036DF7C9B
MIIILSLISDNSEFKTEILMSFFRCLDINALGFMMNQGGISHALSKCDKTAVKKSHFSPVNLVLKSGKKEQAHHEKTGKNFNHEK